MGREGRDGAAPGPFFWLTSAPGCVVGFNGRLAAVNRPWEELLGCRAEAAVGQPAERFVTPADRPRVRRALARAALRGESTFVARGVGPGGDGRPLVWTVARAGDEFYAVGREPAPDTAPPRPGGDPVLARVSHEIRTPMTAILGHADLALERSRDCAGCDCRVPEHWDAVKRHGARLIAHLGDALAAAPAAPNRLVNVPGAGAPEPARRPAPAPARVHGRVLVAEDNRETQQVVALRLTLAGATVTLANHGRAAVELARAARDEGRPFDLILMDMQMPVLDGYGATRLLRDEGFATPVIAVTAYALPEDRAECLRFGCDEYATKPIDWEALFALMARLMARGRPASEAGSGAGAGVVGGLDRAATAG